MSNMSIRCWADKVGNSITLLDVMERLYVGHFLSRLECICFHPQFNVFIACDYIQVLQRERASCDVKMNHVQQQIDQMQAAIK